MLKRKFHVPEDNRTLKALAALDARVYVYCPDRRTKQQFIEDAENEYFCYRDGVSLKEREPEDIMALNRDRTVNFVGYIGHLVFHTTAKEIGDKVLLKVDYRKYVAGEKNFICTSR
ncbi:MAG: hypothetical protein LUE29_02795 [Lachnospiraceae bacterium]|nr:hypothetical protein [Lachnospiraceae bacterium]